MVNSKPQRKLVKKIGRNQEMKKSRTGNMMYRSRSSEDVSSMSIQSSLSVEMDFKKVSPNKKE